MSLTPIDAEAWVVQHVEGRRLLAEIAEAGTPSPKQIERWRASTSLDVTQAALRLAESARRGLDKLPDVDRLWLEPVAVQQATHHVVAAHKASRFRDVGRVVDLCAGLGGDTRALAARAEHIVAVEADPDMVRRLQWNLCRWEINDRVDVRQATAQAVELGFDMAVHIDPDRRAGRTTRARRLEHYEPPLEWLRDLTDRVETGAIKLGPASDFDTAFPDDRFEIELITHRGECREATVWFGPLVTCRRRVTRMPEGVSWSDQDFDDRTIDDAHSTIGPVSAWLFDPDPGLSRSGLLDHFARAHGLHRIEPGRTPLSGETRCDHPLLVPFGVLDILPGKSSTIAGWLRERGAWVVEVKPRGVDVDPHAFRKKLPRGRDNVPGLSLFLVGGNRRGSKAILSQRLGSERDR